MSLARNIGKNSLIYTITNFLQKGISFFLLPVYTRYLTPEDYGVISVVFAINGFLSIFFTLSLEGAVSRFYFEYRNDTPKLREFWGTVFVFIIILSASAGGLTLLFGEWFLKPALDEIPFWPYAALGVATVIFLPFYNIFLAVLQVQQKAREFSFASLGQFGINLSLTIGLVVFAGWGAEGPLTAGLVAAFLYFFITLFVLRGQYVFCLKGHYLKEALAYSVPLIPHSLASQFSSIVDRVFVNNLIGTAAAGLYNIGFMFGSILSYFAENVHRAYLPVAMHAYKEKSTEEMKQIRDLALMLLVLYSIIATGLSLFSKELIWLVTTPEFYPSYKVVPYIAFTFVFSGIYYILVTILFFEKTATKFIGLGTSLGAVANIFLNWTLIPVLGLIGAGLATMLAQSLTTLFVGIIGRKIDPIRWNYSHFILIPSISLGLSLLLLEVVLDQLWMETLLKLVVFSCFVFGINYVIWNDGIYMVRRGMQFFNKRLSTS